MSYDLSIQADDQRSAFADVTAIEALFASYARVERVETKSWIYEPIAGIQIQVWLNSDGPPESPDFNSVLICVPYPVLRQSGVVALRLAFDLAKLLHWRVYDEQLGTYIEETDVPRLVDAQAAFAQTALETLAEADQNWIGRWTAAAAQQRLPFLVFAVAISALLAAAILLCFGAAEKTIGRYLFVVAFPIGIAIFGVKVIFDRRSARGSK